MDAHFQFFPPAHVCFKFVGKVDIDQARLRLDRLAELVKDQRYFHLTVDMSDFDGTTPDARRYSAETLKRLPVRSIGIVGGAFAQRTMAKLVLKAAEMLSGERRQFSKFFKDLEGATDWHESMIPTLLDNSDTKK